MELKTIFFCIFLGRRFSLLGENILDSKKRSTYSTKFGNERKQKKRKKPVSIPVILFFDKNYRVQLHTTNTQIRYPFSRVIQYQITITRDNLCTSVTHNFLLSTVSEMRATRWPSQKRRAVYSIRNLSNFRYRINVNAKVKNNPGTTRLAAVVKSTIKGIRRLHDYKGNAARYTGSCYEN